MEDPGRTAFWESFGCMYIAFVAVVLVACMGIGLVLVFHD
jgi:hypothetical protein